VLIRDKSKTGYDLALVTTDAAASAVQAIERYAARWSVATNYFCMSPSVTIRLAGGGEPRSFGRKNLNCPLEAWRDRGRRLAGLRGCDEAQATRASLVSRG
jgi:hypothetical protein